MARAYQSYPALAFHPDLGSEALEGNFFLNSLSLTFRAANDQQIEIPLQHLIAKFEEAGEGRVLFSNNVEPDWVITTTDLDVLQVTTVPCIVTLAENVTNRLARREIGRRIRYVVWFFAGCVLLAWLGMIATGAMVRAIANRVPFEAEAAKGEALLKEVESHFHFVEQSNVVLNLAELAQPLLQVGPPGIQWRFHLVDAEMPNAFALPGGHIIVTQGLIDLAETPEDLLGPLAHEMAHVTRRHTFRKQIASAGPFLVLGAFLRGRHGLLSTAAGVGSALLVSQSFSQEYEKEADDTVWDYLVAANINPRGMIEMFKKLKAAEAGQTPLPIPKAFLSHPDADKRIARLESRWKKLPRKSGFRQLEFELPPKPIAAGQVEQP